MSLTNVSTGQTILASHINQLVNTLQRQSGQTEVGRYWLGGNMYASGAFISQYIPSLSRFTVPASVSIDTSDQSPSPGAMAAPATGHLTNGGFQVYAGCSAAILSAIAGGKYTITY